MAGTCRNCLNAYNQPHDGKVRCINKEWQQQFEPGIDTTVTADESCGTWQQRKSSQKRIQFHQAIQLELFK